MQLLYMPMQCIRKQKLHKLKSGRMPAGQQQSLRLCLFESLVAK